MTLYIYLYICITKNITFSRQIINIIYYYKFKSLPYGIIIYLFIYLYSINLYVHINNK
jgi:hypothetical protein